MLSVLLATALTLPATTVDPLTSPSTLSARVRDPKVIRAAVDAALVGEEAASVASAAGGTTLRGSGVNYDAFARAVLDARVPDCLHEDGLKRQPTFFLSGYLALPFIAVAKLRGKCN